MTSTSRSPRATAAVVCALGVMVSAGPSLAGGVLRVDDDAPLGGDGRSWATAFSFLQDALAAARDPASGVTEIRVAQGVYKPDRELSHPGGQTSSCCVPSSEAGCDTLSCEIEICLDYPACCTDEWGSDCVFFATLLCGDLCQVPRLATFQLVDGVAVRGGFAGMGAPDPDQRDTNAYETILSGDLLGDDDPDRMPQVSENSYHVVSGSGVGPTAVLDGVTITGGYADRNEFPHDSGAGMLVESGSPTITGCRFIGNAAIAGGGISVHLGGPIVRECVFLNNRSPNYECAVSGGAIRNLDGSPLVTGCVFIGNRAETRCSDAVGGAVSNEGNAGLMMLVNGLFQDNCACGHSQGLGGAVHASAATLIVNSTFNGNFTTGKWPNSSGAVYVTGEGPVTLVNCIAWATGDISAAADVSYSIVQGGFPGPGNVDADPLFVDADSGDYRLQPGSRAIDAGHNWALAPDFADLDADGDASELTPVDLDGSPRFVHAPVGAHAGCGNPAIVDMGPYEFQDGEPTVIVLGDIDGDASVGATDLVAVIVDWGPCEPGCCLSDLDVDRTVGITDLLLVLRLWG